MRYVIILFLLSGCSVEGTMAPGHVSDCLDLRDGEQFTVHSENITDIRIGIGAPSCAIATDDNGKRHQLCNNQDAYLKCTSRP